ncbi:MAG: tRNA 2-thiouridine(34) synthase MnmA [Planctomycetota bacterium]|jgi:tRNA-specific 2-thiouridylase
MAGVRRTLVAMSGGVDSATAAGLLAEAGESLVGVFMRNGVSGGTSTRSCCSLSDARDARAVADRLGIPFYAVDLERPFARLIEAFADDYARGLTPNPCIACNQELKFGELMRLADDLGCEAVATGHYARVDAGVLRRGVDPAKDQSYLLAGLDAEQRSRARFPLGELAKTDVRAHAARLGLGLEDKPDSADICFVPGGDYRAVISARRGDLGRTGALVDADGREVGRHDGIAGLTVGQRRGLGLALGQPVFVTDIDPGSGNVRVGGREDLAKTSCRVGAVRWHVPVSDGAEVFVQLRHHHDAVPARVWQLEEGEVRVDFTSPCDAVTPGQWAVFYERDRVLGGGRLRREELSGGSPASS